MSAAFQIFPHQLSTTRGFGGHQRAGALAVRSLEHGISAMTLLAMDEDGGGPAVAAPSFHQLTALLEQIAAQVGLFDSIADLMGQRFLADFARTACLLSGPITEGTPKTVRGVAGARANLYDQISQRAVAQPAAGRA